MVTVPTSYRLLFFISLIVCLNASHGQQIGTSEMKKLEFLVKNWTVVDVTEVEGEGVGKESTIATFKKIHEGRFIAENVRHLTPFGEINMVTMIGFDSRYNAYKLTAMDKEYGLMDVYIGQWLNESLVFSNLDSDRPIVMDDDRKLNFRLTYYDIDNDSFKHKVEGTYDEGTTWFVFSINQYSSDG